MTEQDVPSGSPAGIAYFVQYSEDLWNALDDERRDFCKETWIKFATPIPDVRILVLKLVPDKLFPSGEHDLPYVAWQVELEKDDDPDYTMSAIVQITMNAEWTAALQSKMMRDLGVRYPSGSKFEIRTRKGVLLSKGAI